MLVLLPLLLVLPGCQRERRGLTSPTSHTAAQRVGMITEARAIDIAKKDLAGGRLRLPRLVSGFMEAADIRSFRRITATKSRN